MLYWTERTYPFILSAILTVVLIKLGFDPLQSENINEVINGIVTLDSIIIGFIGAIIPVILSMKNESKLVKYVFDKDKDGLFRKYLLVTIAVGLLDVCASLAVYLRDIMTSNCVIYAIRIVFVFFFILFVFCTFRSMNCMLKLIFSDDSKVAHTVLHELDQKKKENLWNKHGK